MGTFASIVLTVLALLVLVIFVGSLYAFFFAIFQFIFSAGDGEKIKKAWNSIRYMIIGIIMTLLVLFFFPVILERAKVPGYEYYNANNIFAQVSKITGGLLSLGKDAVVEYRRNDTVINNGELYDGSSSSNKSDKSYEDLEL